MTTINEFHQQKIEEYYVNEEPFYVPSSDEIQVFESAYAQRIPILLKGPTGTGKTRFVEHMVWKLSNNKQPKSKKKTTADIPLITVACWIDGPLTKAVKSGGICYLDEVVEARKDTTVIIHPLTDHRRTLTIDKLGEVVDAADGFLLVVSYNPGYQNAMKDLKHSTRQRFVALEFNFPDQERETQIIHHESGVSLEISERLAKLGEKIRNLREHGLDEGASTRVLIYAGKLIKQGISARRACEVAVTWGITDDSRTQKSINEVVTSIFP